MSQLDKSIVFQTLLKGTAFESFMVYDNSPTYYEFDKTLLPPNAVYIRNYENGGVSTAYNTGAQYALQHGYTHVLLLDQDTHFPLDAAKIYFKNLNDSIICSPTIITKKGVPFSPCSRKGFKTKAVSLPSGVYNIRDYSPINSGLCIPIKIFQKVGGYNDNVKLDFADFEFISRCRKECLYLNLLPFVAVQDFSNDEQNVKKLLSRYRLYIESALAANWVTISETILMRVEVLLHTFSLIKRTRSLKFLKVYLTKFFFKFK